MSPLGKSAPSAVVGLDIGSDLIKVAEAKLAKDGIHITGMAVSPTPEGVLDNSVIVDPQALGAAVKRLLKESGIKTKHVVSSISGQSSVVVRVIDVPKMTHDELAETMKWEVERHVPFSPTEIVMDFAAIDKPGAMPDAPNMEVLLAVAQQDAVNSHVQMLFAAGLEPIAIDVQPLAVSRALIDVAEGTAPQTVAVVNIGATTTDVGVFEAGLLTFPGPPLPIAGVNLTRAISEALGVPEEEAEMLKKEYASADLSAAQGIGDDMAYDDTEVEPEEPVEEITSFDPSFHANGEQDQPQQSYDMSYDTSVAQSGSDFSPFDFSAPAAPPPQEQMEEAQQDVTAADDDVFDLGGGDEQASEFKPIFDLDEPDVAEVRAPAGPTFDLDLEDDHIAASAGQVQATAEDVTAAQINDYSFVQVEAAQNGRPDVTNAVTPVLIELATEIRRSIDYYTTRYQNRPDRIFLCGGTAKLRDLDEFLANELGIPVEVADPMANLAVSCPKYSQQYLKEVSPLFPVSIGLAIREMLE